MFTGRQFGPEELPDEIPFRGVTYQRIYPPVLAFVDPLFFLMPPPAEPLPIKAPATVEDVGKMARTCDASDAPVIAFPTREAAESWRERMRLEERMTIFVTERNALVFLCSYARRDLHVYQGKGQENV